jgi:DNA-binding PadR family transcriptional regulator
MAVTELATNLRISHASISQTRQSLEAAGLLVSETDPEDTRRRQLAISPAGHKLLEKLRPLWAAFEQAAADLDAEAGNVVDALDRLEDALSQRSMFDRIQHQLARGEDRSGLRAPARAPTKAVAKTGRTRKGKLARR